MSIFREKKAWYYIEEGANDETFKEIGKKHSQWLNIFCMNDKLCCVSLYQKCLYMYPLKQNEACFGGRQWSKVSYEYIIRNSTGYDSEFNSIRDVRICCNDGERIYLVVKVPRFNEWRDALEIQFKCYKLSNRHSWEFVFDMQITDNLDVYESRHFDMHVPPGKNGMLIVVAGDQFNVFRVNLENKEEGVQEYTLKYENKWSEMSWTSHSHFWIIRSKNHLSFVDEMYANETDRLYYRNVIIMDKVEGMSVDFTEHSVIKHRLPSDNRLNSTTKLFQSVSAGSSAWLYLSDGRFQTFLDEIRLSKYGGFLNRNRHISPPFQSVALLATGMVNREILANLIPVEEFLQE